MGEDVVEEEVEEEVEEDEVEVEGVVLEVEEVIGVATYKEKLLLYEEDPLSVTCTEKVKSPEALGVPEIVPPEPSERPVGKEPDVSVKV